MTGAPKPELLPCPFCGADPMLNEIAPHKHYFVDFPDHEGSAVVECPACEAGMIAATVDEVVAIWNRRAPRPVLPERDATKPAEQQGLFGKFIVQRADGSDQPGGKHHGCFYFVLDADHDPHAIPALRAYAEACAETHPQLASDLRDRIGAPPRPEITDAEKVAYRTIERALECFRDSEFARLLRLSTPDKTASMYATARFAANGNLNDIVDALAWLAAIREERGRNG